MYAHIGVFVVIQARTAQLFVIQFKAEWTDQVQLCPSVGTQADNIAGVGRNLGLEQDYIKHGLNISSEFYFALRLSTVYFELPNTEPVLATDPAIVFQMPEREAFRANLLNWKFLPRRITGILPSFSWLLVWLIRFSL